MRTLQLRLLAGFLASTSLAFAQLDSNSITITSYRAIDLLPDHLIFSVTVNANFNASLDDVLSALQGSGITAANLTGVYGGQEPLLPTTTFVTTTSGPRLTWAFFILVPLEQIQTKMASLTALQQNIAQRANGLSLTFNVQYAQVSPLSQQADHCPTRDLVSDAQTQARKLADAAGLTVGPIAAISDQSAPSSGDYAVANVGAFASPPGVSQIGFGYATFLLGATSYTTTTSHLFTPSLYCAITVKFQLLRYQ